MCFSRITQRHPATNRQNELAIAHVIGKLTQLGWIRPRAHARNLHCRILGRRAFRQDSGVAKGAGTNPLSAPGRDALLCIGEGIRTQAKKWLDPEQYPEVFRNPVKPEQAK